MMLSSGSRKNSVRWRQSGRSVGPLRIGTPLATNSAWQASTAGGGTRKASWTAADPGIDLPSSQTVHAVRGRSVNSAAPTRKLTQCFWSVSTGNFMTSR